MNVFAKAQPAAAPAAKKPGKVEKPTIKITGLEELAAIDAVMKSLKALRETVEVDVKRAQREHFITEGMKIGRRPENFKASEGIATASCELRARGSNSPLSDDEQAALKPYGIPTETVESVKETYIINPAYFNDGDLLQRIGAAIGKVKGVPEDFIQKQEAVSKVIVSEGALDKLFAIKEKAVITALFNTVGGLAIKPTVGDKVREALQIVQGVVFPDHGAAPAPTVAPEVLVTAAPAPAAKSAKKSKVAA